tara:strand:+ start:8477 stop:8674 length:198 start_codon:yes stop_codon:yes gene_type:complete
MKNTNNNEVVRLIYSVLNSSDEIVRRGWISGSFDSSMPYIEMIDELLEQAYEKEEIEGEWSIVEA